VPAKPEGVYQDGHGGWYVKVSLGRDPLTGRREQITRRGFRTATEAGRARRELLGQVDRGQLKAVPGGTTVNELMDLYLDGIDADGRLSAKTCFDYRHSTDDYIRPGLGAKRVRDVTVETVLAWQRMLSKEGGTKNGRPLSANTVRLARAPLAGAFRLAVTTGMVAVNPMVSAPRPKARRSVPRHWTPEQARDFLGLMEGDRTWPLWAFLLGAGLRIGELVWLRWPSVDLDRGLVRIVDFVSTLGHDLVVSSGKSRDAIRTIDLDPGLVGVLRRQRALQAQEQMAAKRWEPSEFVFTKPTGGSYHPQYLSKLLATYSTELGLPRLTAHGLRHTSATLMLSSGVPAKVAAERLGHADATLFTNLYSHVTPTMQRDAAGKIGAALFGLPVAAPVTSDHTAGS
jgi:integrase